MCASGSSYATECPPLDMPLVSKWPLRFGNDLQGQKFCIFRLCLEREEKTLWLVSFCFGDGDKQLIADNESSELNSINASFNLLNYDV